MKRLQWILIVLTVLSLLLAACGKATPTPAPKPTQAPPPTKAPAPTKAPEPTQAPTEPPKPAIDPTGQTITFWHVWGQGQPSETMAAIVDEFNKTNEWGITVEAVDQGRYGDLEDAFNAAIQSGDVPDIVVGYTNALANWFAVDAIVDLRPFVDDPDFGLTDADKADFFAGSFAANTIGSGEMVGFPISQSANVLFYNSTWAKELGFDHPPTNAAEFKEQACAAAQANATDDNPDNDGTGGLVLYPGASNIMSWIFAFGGDIIAADGSYDFTNQTVQDVMAFLKDLQDNGCAFQTESYPNPEFATRKALFTMSSTAGIPYQLKAFQAEDATQDEWMLIPFVGPDGTQAVDGFSQSVAVVNTTPEREMAAWLFIKYFTSPETQAKWIQGAAYYPTRQSTIDLLGDYATQNPQWATALSFLQYAHSEPARPSWSSVRREVGNAANRIILGGEDMMTVLQELNQTAAEAVAETEQ